jgi:hypothetical protein
MGRGAFEDARAHYTDALVKKRAAAAATTTNANSRATRAKACT